MEKQKLRNYEGNYERYLERNEEEAVKVEEKEGKKREVEKSQIKAKSKVYLCPVRIVSPLHACLARL